MLLHLLDDSTPLHARFSAKDQMAILRQGPHRPTLLARLAHLGVRKSPSIQGPFHSACHRDGERLFLGVFEGSERVSCGLRDIDCEYPGLYGGCLRCLQDVLDADSNP